MLLGDNAFIGVSHLSQLSAREKLEKLHLETILKTIETAIANGASGFTFSTHPTNFQILKALRNAGEVDRNFDLYPVLPYAEGYVRMVNEKGMIGLVKEILSRLPLSKRAEVMIDAGISAVTFDAIGMLRAYLDSELGSYLSVKPKMATLEAVLLHEVVTDLALSFKSRQLFDSFIAHIRDKYDANPGFVTRNVVRFIDFFRESGLPIEDVVVMAPFNKVGFQMNPSRESCESCLSGIRGGKVLAISILAGGYLSIEEGAQYLRTLPSLSGAAVGVSSPQHAEESFTKLRDLFAEPD